MKKIFVGIVYFLISLVFLLPFIGVGLKSINFKMWEYVLLNEKTYLSLLSTFMVASIAMLINFLIGTPLASFMAREDFKGKKMIELLIILPLIIPTMVSTMGLQFAFIKLGLIETTLGVGIVHSVTTMPYYVQSMKAGYMTLSKDYINLGKILGANPIQRFFKITLPIISPSFLVGMSLVIIVSLSQYLVTFIIGGGQVMTLPILMMPYLSDGDMRNGTVYSIIYVLFTYFLVFLVGRLVKFIYRKSDRCR
ncbi:ABC transporter permease subunit [Cetobacterium sp. 8H]|uniref:ABC transporter permease n=1 Tax=Cetobacterium sp. 8H TaxID=2759681 RepID=UPI00163D34D6|nr:ABC transporter permease subunit [Cetobacterium sp. 8H]MBC2851672.1 ABC transporter permease subunit [Cetobacterium sp. 8H]